MTDALSGDDARSRDAYAAGQYDLDRASTEARNAFSARVCARMHGF
jgi:hypothetical protein